MDDVWLLTNSVPSGNAVVQQNMWTSTGLESQSQLPGGQDTMGGAVLQLIDSDTYDELLDESVSFSVRSCNALEKLKEWGFKDNYDHIFFHVSQENIVSYPTATHMNTHQPAIWGAGVPTTDLWNCGNWGVKGVTLLQTMSGNPGEMRAFFHEFFHQYAVKTGMMDVLAKGESGSSTIANQWAGHW